MAGIIYIYEWEKLYKRSKIKEGIENCMKDMGGIYINGTVTFLFL
jgi:hypothetical protein